MAKTTITPKLSPIATPSARTARVVRPAVISFRVSNAQAQTLEAIFNQQGATGVNSPKQLARKIVADYLAGRLVYKNEADKGKDYDLISG